MISCMWNFFVPPIIPPHVKFPTFLCSVISRLVGVLQGLRTIMANSWIQTWSWQPLISLCRLFPLSELWFTQFSSTSDRISIPPSVQVLRVWLQSSTNSATTNSSPLMQFSYYFGLKSRSFKIVTINRTWVISIRLKSIDALTEQTNWDRHIVGRMKYGSGKSPI